jgi:hypothetical protein
MSAGQMLILHLDTDRSHTIRSAVDEISSALEYDGFSNVIINAPIWSSYVMADNVKDFSKEARAKLLNDLGTAVAKICTEAGL